jgi:hypothetical protein
MRPLAPELSTWERSTPSSSAFCLAACVASGSSSAGESAEAPTVPSPAFPETLTAPFESRSARTTSQEPKLPEIIGRAQQRKGEAGEEAAQRAKTRQTEKEARDAEKERDRQRRKDKGPLGGIGDTLSGR